MDGCPRNLYVDGITNVRDVGGWKTLDGGRVRQGLLFRGSKLAANKNAKQILITEKGIATLRDELGVRSEIDLRLETQLGGLTSSPLGNTVNFYSRPMEDDYNTMFTTASNLQNVRAVFALLADESNYPIYFHCSIGADRTGLIAILFLDAFGADREVIIRDYMSTNEHLKPQTEWIANEVAKTDDDPRLIEQVNVMNTVYPEYADAIFEKIDSFGGSRKYLTDVLGFSEEQLAELEHLYLE